MTNEDAREILEELWRYKETVKYTDIEIREALDLAIKALEQQPCEDCISRKDLLEKFTEECTSECACCMYVRDGYSCGLIEDAPSVTPKALEQTDGDCISRADVKKYLSAPDANGERIIYESDLDLLPPVQPMPKMGHWVEYTRVLIPEPINRWEQAWYCSECGYGNQECEDDSTWLEWKYCPKCGARMESDKE